MKDDQDGQGRAEPTRAENYANQVADYYEAVYRRLGGDPEMVRQLTLEYQRRLLEWAI